MSWFRRLFSRVPKRPCRPVDDWKAGDLGKCIVTLGPNGRYWTNAFGEASKGPNPGQTVRVTGVMFHPLWPNHPFLALNGWPNQIFSATEFVKLDEKGEGELVERIKKIYVPDRTKRELTDA